MKVFANRALEGGRRFVVEVVAKEAIQKPTLPLQAYGNWYIASDANLVTGAGLDGKPVAVVCGHGYGVNISDMDTPPNLAAGVVSDLMKTHQVAERYENDSDFDLARIANVAIYAKGIYQEGASLSNELEARVKNRLMPFLTEKAETPKAETSRRQAKPKTEKKVATEEGATNG